MNYLVIKFIILFCGVLATIFFEFAWIYELNQAIKELKDRKSSMFTGNPFIYQARQKVERIFIRILVFLILTAFCLYHMYLTINKIVYE
jgi:hypothetical protein